jgi:uncharacterized FAD-dependent dehydrogenase
MQDLCEIIYDPTFFVQTTKYDDQTRTFCTNAGGFVSIENYKDFVCVNGHAYKHKKSNNSNLSCNALGILKGDVAALGNESEKGI